MKLYIWVDPYPVDYGGSLVFAVAETLDQAIEIASSKTKTYAYGFSEQDKPKVVLGKPTRILDLPNAEWFEWSE